MYLGFNKTLKISFVKSRGLTRATLSLFPASKHSHALRNI